MTRRELLSWCASGAASSAIWLPQQVLAQSEPGRARVTQGAPAVTAEANPRQPRPPADSIEQQLSPELEAFLVEWEQKSSRIERLRGKFVRYVYDTVYSVEKRATGEFWYQSPDQGRMDIVGAELKQWPPKQAANGQPFTLQPDAGQRWICNGKEVYILWDDQKIYDHIQIPPQQQGRNIINGPLPFLFGMKAEDAKARYYLAHGSMHFPRGGTRPDDDGNPVQMTPKVHLVAAPKLPLDKREWQRAEVLLEPESLLPISIRLLDPSGSKETVYRFFPGRYMSVNEAIWFPNPLKAGPPRDYTLGQDSRAEADPLQPNGAAPAGGGRRGP